MPAFLIRLMDWVRDRFDPIVQAPKPLITVTAVMPLGDSSGSRRLRLAFSDNQTGVIDLARHVEFVGTLAPLADLNFFRQAYVDHGTVCWPGDIDMDATVLHHLAFGMPIDLVHEQPARGKATPPNRRQPGKASIR